MAKALIPGLSPPDMSMDRVPPTPPDWRIFTPLRLTDLSLRWKRTA
jgi:hypothetical protein